MRAWLAWTAGGAALVAGAFLVREIRRPRVPPPPPPPPAATDFFGDPLPPYAVARMGTVRRPTATNGFAFSPDGRELYAGGDDGVVRRFDAASGAMLGERRTGERFRTVPRVRSAWSWLTDLFEGRRDEVVADLSWQTAFSDDGRWVAALAEERVTLRPMSGDATGGSETRRAGRTAQALSFAPHGTRLAIAWDDGQVTVGSPGAAFATAATAGGGAQGVALARDGTRIAVMAQGCVLLDAASGAVLANAAGDKEFAPRGIAFSPDGTRIAHAQGRNGLVLRDATTFAVAWELSDPKRTNWGAVAFSPDGRTIAWGVNGVGIVDAATGAVTRFLETDGVEAWALSFSPDGSRLAATSAGVVRTWDTATWTEILPCVPPRSAVLDVEFSPDGRALFTRGRGRCVDVWDAATGALRWSAELAGWNGDAAWTPDGAAVRCACWRPEATDLVTLDASTGAETGRVALPKYSRFVLHGPSPLMLRFSGSSQTWDLVDPYSCRSVRTLQGNTIGGVSSISRDGRLLASTDGRQSLDVLDLTTGSRTAPGVSWSRGDGTARLVALSPDASLVALAIERGRLLVADLATGKTRLSADSGLHGAATSLALSPDGRLLAVGDPFGEVHLWSVADGAELFAFSGHRGHVWTLDFSPDGSRLASGSSDATVLVWDVARFGRGR